MPSQFITHQKGNKISAVLPIRQYEAILEQLDELACIIAYDEAKAKKKQELIPLKEALEQADKNRKA